MLKTMLSLFGQAIRKDAGKDAIPLEREAWIEMLKLSSAHDMAHLIGYALKDADVQMDENIKKAFVQKADMAIFRYAKIGYELEAMEKALEKACVRFIPLKGSYIRKYYQEPWMRTSGDIDILICKEDVEKVRAVFENELHYSYDFSWNYEHTFVTQTGIEIELHHVLSDEVAAIDAVLATVWERSAPVEGHSYLYEMSDEMFYFYHIAHMAKHFVKGGCGIRSILDVYVLGHNCTFDREKRYALLEEARLCTFAKAVEALAEVWFGGASHTPLTEKLEGFILSGGNYGTAGNRIAVERVMAGGKRSYILSRIFLPYDRLRLIYPKLEGRKWLLPFYQVKRWFRIFKKGKLKRSLCEVQTNAAITTEDDTNIENLLQNLGLR